MTKKKDRPKLSGRIRNAVTESWDDGDSIALIAHKHGLSEQRVKDLLTAARAGYGSPEAMAEAQAK